MFQKNDGEKVRDSNRTKRKLFNAVGEILKKEGYKGLGTNKIARYAEVDKKLIYRYFGKTDNLIEAYVLEKDYWASAVNKVDRLLEINQQNHGRNLAAEVLTIQFEHLFEHLELQHVLLWEVNEKTELMNRIMRLREYIAGALLELTDPHFAGSPVNFRAVEAILMAGIHYLVLQSRNNPGTFCGINIQREADRKVVVKTLRQMVDWAFEAAGITDTRL